MNKAKKLRLVLILLLLVGLWASVDLGYNFFYSLIPEVNDGITIRGFCAQLLLPDHGWSRVRYLELFRGAVSLTALDGIALLASRVLVPVKD